MHSIFICDISRLRPWMCSPGILFCPQILNTCRSRSWGFLSRSLKLTLWIHAGFSKAGVNGPGNILPLYFYVERMTEQLSFSVILPKIRTLRTPREQKILFEGIIILGKCPAVLKDTDESNTASPVLSAPAKCAKKPGRDFPTPISCPGQGCLWNKGGQVAVGGFLPGQSLHFTWAEMRRKTSPTTRKYLCLKKTAFRGFFLWL